MLDFQSKCSVRSEKNSFLNFSWKLLQLQQKVLSTYRPSEIRDRHPLRFAKDFREYSPIQEEDESDVDEEGGKNHEKKQKRPR